MTDYNDLLRDCVAEFRPNTRPSRPTRPQDNAPAPERAEWDDDSTIEYKPADGWIPKPRPVEPKPRRAMLAFAALMAIVPAPIMPALLIVPLVAGVVVFGWLVVGSGWGLYIGP